MGITLVSAWSTSGPEPTVGCAIKHVHEKDGRLVHFPGNAELHNLFADALREKGKRNAPDTFRVLLSGPAYNALLIEVDEGLPHAVWTHFVLLLRRHTVRRS